MTILLALMHTPSVFGSDAHPPVSVSSSAGQSGMVSPWTAAVNRYGVSEPVLHAIAIQETGVRWTDGLVRPWPWTLNSPSGGPMFFRNKADAIRGLRELLRRGERNVDVGIMQINLRANGWRARNPESLLDTGVNISVAAEIYSELLWKHGGDMRAALALYHSPRRDLGDRYAESVIGIIRMMLVYGNTRMLPIH